MTHHDVPTGSGLSTAIVVIWAAAAVVSVFTPPLETGSDPTTVPLAASIAPVAAIAATTMAGVATLVVERLARAD